MNVEKEENRRLLENLPDAYAYCRLNTDMEGKSIDYTFIEVNTAFEKITRLKRENVTGKSVSKIYPGINERASGWIEIYGQIAKTGEYINFERYFEPDARWYKVTAYGDDPGYFVIIFRDITWSKKVEEELRQSEENLRATLYSIGDGVIATDINGLVFRMNPVAEKLTGWMLDEARGKPLTDVFEIVCSHTREPVANPVQQVFESGEIAGLANHTLLIARNGMEYQIADSAAPIRDTEGRTTGVVLVFRDITNEYLLQQKLRESEEKFRAAFEGSYDAVVIVTKEKFVDCNQRALELFELDSKEEFREKRPAYFSPPTQPDGGNSFELADKNIEESFEKGFAHFEWVFQSKCGRIFTAEVIHTMYQSRGETYLQATIRDITERKHIEQKLRESEEKYRLMFENSPLGIVHVKYDGNITACNETFINIIGSQLGSLVGLNMLDLPDQKMVSVVQEALQGEKSYYEGWYHSITSGKVTAIRGIATPFITEKGNVNGGIGILEDITDRKRAEDELKRSEERYRILVENANEAIVIVQEGVHKFVNTKAVELFGCSSKEEILCRPVTDFMHPENKEKVLENIKKTLDGEINQDTLSFRIIARDGNVKWVEVNATRIEWEGRPASLSLITDVTERKMLEEKAAKSEKMFRYIAEFSPLPLAIIDDEGNYEYINPKFEEVFGYTLSDIPTGREWLKLAHPDPEYRWEIIRLWKSDFERIGRNAPRPRALKVTCKDGSEKDIFFRPVFMDNEKHLVTYEDVTEQKRYENQLRYLSLHDQLTGLYNRHFLEEEIKRIDTERQLPVSVIMADLNGLKLVNDTYGHSTGDEMLKNAARILKESCRSEDIIGRWGGDEFVILLPQTMEEKAEDICRRINGRYSDVYIKDVPISLAMGVSIKETSEMSLAAILQKAEDNMYKQKLLESKSTRGAVLNSLLKALEAKSFETEEHTKQMQAIAGRIAEKLGLLESELNRLNLAITLHDIGKINISEDILTKEDPLTPQEWEVIKKHPETGYRIARAAEEFAHVAEEILAHHERWDGSGYPRGLKGEEIPLLARIIAIVDAYEVMKNGRPYKASMTREEIVAELKKYAGIQFDPKLAEAFIEILENEI